MNSKIEEVVKEFEEKYLAYIDSGVVMADGKTRVNDWLRTRLQSTIEEVIGAALPEEKDKYVEYFDSWNNCRAELLRNLSKQGIEITNKQ